MPVTCLYRMPNHPQYSGVMRIIEVVQFGILAVNCQGILCQIVSPQREEIHFLRQFLRHHYGSRGFDHNADLHLAYSCAPLLQLLEPFFTMMVWGVLLRT